MASSVGGFAGSALLANLRTFRASNALTAFSEWHASTMGHRALGLKGDDLIPEEGPLVQEALRRLSPQETENRLFRFRRAYALSTTQTELAPKDQISAAEDQPYLRPLIDIVEAEIATKENFDLLTAIPEQLKRRNRSS
ncbi:14 kDa subunit of cytochrome bd ubiquinol oxidase [Rhizoclosmatium globosum]|uniref:Complex III subunit 7 n=1 Tax=Rhizoclosmatium globosum TaxID=329046 RepID=A0A1Y2CNL3_9FUNG|nr:14 kDa subunit of cytochrome bd ubiquinol oxidase [Rhizoclosmatium globosum]|eukprot:ORY48536.1 14 kDa subunit of cytochrome bd ubiquinol oxidase [Rhizoclosmatium globosum]